MARILVVDDEELILELFAEILEEQGYEVMRASDGEAALSIVRSQQIDLVLLDIFMPGKEGLESIQELRQIRPEIKIIAMSGGGGSLGTGLPLDLARRMGASVCLEKPVRKELLIKTVTDTLSA